MKRILSMVVALTIASTMAVTAFAEATCDPSEVYGGERVTIDTDQFFDGDVPLDDTLYKPDKKQEIKGHSLTASWKKNGSYIQEVYFEDGDSYVTIVIKPNINVTSTKSITGQLKIRDNDNRRNYICKIEEDDLVLKGIDEKENMWEDGDKEFSLPNDYQTKKVRFTSDEGNKYGTFTADFDNDYGDRIATFVVKVIDQGPLFLGFNEGENIDLMKKFPDADMRFINWKYPKFEMKGKLSIYMEPDEYIYGINTDGSLYRLGGSWDNANDAYVITTDTLGCYVVSDTQLIKTSGSGTTTTTPKPSSSTAPKPSSSVAPPPSSSVAPPPSSSVAPPPSSSVAPPPSSVPEPEPSSTPEPEPEPDPEPSRPASTKPDDDDDDDDDDKDKDKDEKGFPIIPVLLGALILVVVVCTVIVLGNQNSSQRSRRKHFDDWDD